MANFLESFKKGMVAAEKAIANKDDIDSVFQELSDEIEKATEGKIKIKITTLQEPFNTIGMTISDVMNRKTYQAIVAYSPLSVGDPQELARWKISENGYPCRVVLPDTEIYCEDRKALEGALSKLISTSTTGKIFKALLERQPRLPVDDDI
ncbi:hypothetical protein [Pseudomonas sp. LAIL14HWK12:I7]|uniref:hypothetical protein n=1 Tax=Pseudomonas sp. LAIL14HWK12:I7 TaxID=1259801 RepID=UPI000487E016|nr:hypothetical protein [Pseudomonas sp. LAIL14HWK12:I7]